jgi:integrase/recombinase XerD
MDDRAGRVRVGGPLAEHAEGFRAMLAGRGYAPSSAAGLLQVMAHLSRWLAQEGPLADDLDRATVDRFLAARKAAGYRRWLSARGVAPLLEYLETAGLVIPVASPEAQAPGSDVIAGYREYLVTERGLATSTVRNYLDATRLLVAREGLRLDALTAGDVIGFMLTQCRNRGTGSAAVLVTGLRSLLRYLHLAGFTPVSLADAVPSAASARSPRWNLVTSTGGTGSSPSAVKAVAGTSSRCPPTPGRRSRPGCAAAAPAARAGRSSPRCWPRSARSPARRSRRS